jgi:uncharacterized protein (TIGR02271 family)
MKRGEELDLCTDNLFVRRKHMTTTEQSIVVGLFQDRAMAEQAVDDLERAGFSHDQISFSGHGAPTGGFLAGLKSLFTGEGTTGGVLHDLVGMGMPSEDAQYYQQEYEAGRSVVAVTDADTSRLQEASTILARYGGYGASRRSAQATDEAVSAPTTAQGAMGATDGVRRMQVHEEQLQVYKRPAQVGEVRLGKEVVSEQKTINVPTTREEVYIERRPVSGEVSDTPIGEGETIRVPVSEEQINVSKQTVQTGEVSIGKRQVQETQQVKDTIRREEVRIDRKGEVNSEGNDPGMQGQ